MEERKSWASSETAKHHNGVFECLAHNLALLMEEEMKRRGLKDEVEERKSVARKRSYRNRKRKCNGGRIKLHRECHNQSNPKNCPIYPLAANCTLQSKTSERVHSHAGACLVSKKIMNFSTPIFHTPGDRQIVEIRLVR